VTELVELQKHYKKIAQHGVKLFAVSVDPPDASEALRQRLNLDFTFLSDADGEVLDLFNIRHRGARRDGADIAYPTQILIDRDGIIRWTYSSEFYRVRARPDEIFVALEELPD
jgi:peroxiredoxin